MATKDKGLEKSLSKTLVDDIINQGTATINAVVGQQQTTIAAVTAHTDLEIARVGNATQAKKVELETKKDEMLIDINTQGGNAVTQAIATINSHTDDKKIDLDNHEQAKEVQMNELYSNLEAELQRLITEALQDRGIVINGADWHNLTSGNYYVSDLMGSNYINQPQLDPDENSGIVLVSTSGRGKYKVIRYYSVAKRMHFLINANNTWSEWSTVSEGGGLKYEYTQPNHGFTFNAVQLDGNTNTWVLADKNTGADGIAVRIDNNRFELAISGSYHIPSATRDSQNRVIEADEFYFLSNSQIGGFDKEKPIELFQPLFRTYLDEENRMLAEIDIDTPVNLVPRILVDEIDSIGLQLERDNRLQTVDKTVVGGINELENGKLDKTSIVNDLTTGGVDKVLSAEQGKNLNIYVDGKNTIKIFDDRHRTPKPVDYESFKTTFTFNNNDSPFNGDWASIMTMKGWGEGYAPIQIAGYAGGYTSHGKSLFYRKANSETTWGNWEEIFTTGNSPTLKSHNGYQKLPTGLIIQWGTINNPSNNPITAYNFPTAFTSMDYKIIITEIAQAPTTWTGKASVFRPINNSQFGLASWDSGGKWAWIAIGY